MLILDRAPLPEVTASLDQAPDLRVSTLTPSSVRLFTESGAWGDMAPPRSAPFQHMQVLPLRNCCKSFSETYLCIFSAHAGTAILSSISSLFMLLLSHVFAAMGS